VFCSKCRTCTILAHSQGPRWMRKPVLSLRPSLCPRADLKALSGGQETPSPDLAAGPPRRSPPRQSPLAGSSPSAASAMHKTTGRLLRSPHRTPLPSSHFAADGQSARPSASFAPPPALGCSCHHYAPVNSLRLVVCMGCLRTPSDYTGSRQSRDWVKNTVEGA